jgi:hypothetical protein
VFREEDGVEGGFTSNGEKVASEECAMIYQGCTAVLKTYMTGENARMQVYVVVARCCRAYDPDAGSVKPQAWFGPRDEQPNLSKWCRLG